MSKYFDFVTFGGKAKAVLMLILSVAAGLTAMPILAAAPTAEGGQVIDWGMMGITLLGGLAVFLYGMEQMAEALKKVAGDSMKQILGRLTNSRIMGLITGAFVTPSLAMDRARLEIGHMGEYVNQMLTKSMPAFLAGDRDRVKEVSAIDDKVDTLYSEIVEYLGKVSRLQLMDAQARELSNLLSAANDLESIGDIIETDAVSLAEHCFNNDVRISEATQNVLFGLHTTIAGSVERALHSVAANDATAAQDVIAMKAEIQTEVELAEQHQAQRLVADAPNRIAAYSVEMEVIEKLKRIYYFAKRMAKTVENDEMAAVAQPA